MRNITLTITVLVVLAGSVIAPSIASAQYFGNFRQEPTNRFNMGFRAFDRPTDRNTDPIVVNGNNGRTILNAGQAADLGGGLGVDLNYIFATDYGCNYEIRGTFTDWDTTNTRRGANLTTPLGGTQSFQQIDTVYDSTLFSIELNQRRDLHPLFTSIVGIRYTSLEETFEFTGKGRTPTVPDFPLTVTQTTETKNPMIGFQLGGESRIALMAGIHMDITGKAGVYSNTAAQTNTNDTNFTAATRRMGSNTDATIMGEISARMHYDLILDRVSLFLGYDGIYLNGVAIAPNNVARNTDVEDDEMLYFNGIHFGLSLKR